MLVLVDPAQPETSRAADIGNPVTALDFAVALAGVAVLFGLAFEWVAGSGSSGYEGISILRVILVLTGLAGIALPLVLARTRKSDVPVVWEGFLAPLSSVLFLVLALKLLLPPGDGAGTGLFVVTAAMLALTVCCWKTLSRES